MDINLVKKELSCKLFNDSDSKRIVNYKQIKQGKVYIYKNIKFIYKYYRKDIDGDMIYLISYYELNNDSKDSDTVYVYTKTGKGIDQAILKILKSVTDIEI